MKTEAQAWSNPKHHNTWKGLIGISRNCVLTFVYSL